jgi:uncharacterized protein
MTAPLDIRRLRRQAVAWSLVAPTTLRRAMATFGFVQADPIRSPARAQDLILRHRVAGYRAGDLERAFERLRLEEDFLYAYGFMPPDTIRLLHPRSAAAGADGHQPVGLAADVLAFVRERGPTHPRDLEARFGRERAVNGWGGFSKATTRALQGLHHQGLLRVARRQDGIRIYEAQPSRPEPIAPEERTRRVVRLVTRILAPVPQASLRATLALVAGRTPGLGKPAHAVRDLLKSGELESRRVDGEDYLWLAGSRMAERDGAAGEVRFLAPFDPIVWDRRRFEHLWGWAYRFEAYTPAAKRRFGYYAMPLLWGDDVVGWANLAAPAGVLQADVGFSKSRPKGRDFARAFDAEVARTEAFLAPRR